MARLLVIDDDPRIRETVRRVLESRGRQDGIETLLELRKGFPKLRVIVTSSRLEVIPRGS